MKPALLILIFTMSALAGYSIAPKKEEAKHFKVIRESDEALRLLPKQGEVEVTYIDEKARAAILGMLDCQGHLKSVTNQRALKKAFEYLLEQKVGKGSYCPTNQVPSK